MRSKFTRKLTDLLFTIVSFGSFSLFSAQSATAASFQLSWSDNSSNEAGFNIERKTGTTGSFSLIAATSANISSYTDSGLADGTTYCYRMNAFNSAGASPYTAEVCGTTPTAAPSTYSLTVSVQGSGTVTSSPSGINCGSTCSKAFTSGITVTLQASAASGYTFSGWGGDADCTNGSLLMNGNKSCTATFTANPIIPTNYLLTVSSVGVVSGAGTGSGKVVSSPTGINCGTACSASFVSGTVVTLQPMPDAGSSFAGWTGDADCSDNVVTMNGNRSCSASFKKISYTLTVSLSGNGTGKITSSAGGLDCGTNCLAEYAHGTTVGLTATSAPGSIFSAWSGDTDCLDGSVTMNASKTCTAIFSQSNTLNIGLYRPSTGSWYLVANPTGLFQNCNVDRCIDSFGTDVDSPLLADWTGSGRSKLALYDRSRKIWELDANDNTVWDGCQTDKCYNFSVAPKNEPEVPLFGSWDGSIKQVAGAFRFVTSSSSKRGSNKGTASTQGYWYLDRNGNGKWDGCNTDLCLGPFGAPGDVPVVGNWDGSTVSKVGVFTSQTGMWTLDYNGNGKFDGCSVDKCFGPFGESGDIPVVGDWDGTGTAKIGIFSALHGEWFLDFNGNGQWDDGVDKYISGFGQPGDLPVVGRW